MNDAHLVDTSILGRLANTADPANPAAVRAILALHRRGITLHVAPQILIEFRAIATRPVSANGLGFTAAEAEAEAEDFELQFPLLPDTPEIFDAWKKLVSLAQVTGKQVHDARLVAICHVHRISHVLTFNLAHFERLAPFGPGIVVVDPVLVCGDSSA